jgi:hypothetical protein
MDFSGTSLVAGLLHLAGISMGDVGDEQDVAASDRPVRYRTFQCRDFDQRVRPLALEFEENLPSIPSEWLHKLTNCWVNYCEYRDRKARGKLWGVKCNGLLFLALYEGFPFDSVQWVTTCRDYEESVQSAEQKLGPLSNIARMSLEAQVVPQLALRLSPSVIRAPFDQLLQQPMRSTYQLLSYFGLGHLAFRVANLIDPVSKGVIPCHGLSLAPPS